MATDAQLRRAVLWVASLNAAYFVVEISVGLSIQSVSLLADSIDFLEDASINLLIVIGLGLSIRDRARLGSVLAVLIAIPGVSALVAAVDKLIHPSVPSVAALSVTAAGALFANGVAALIVARIRGHEHSLVQAAWLSARNDVLANVAILFAAFGTAVISSPYWDIAVGVGIGVLNADAAVTVWRRSRAELRSPAS